MIRRVLALAHDASRTGAPATLRNLLRWAHDERGAQVTTVVLADGPLVDAFAALGEVRVVPAPVAASHRLGPALGRPQLGRPVRDAWLRRALADAPAHDLVLASSAAALGATALLPAGSPPLACHLHELDGVLDALGGPDALAAPLAAAALVVAAADEVAAVATRPVAEGGLGVPADRVVVHPGPLDPPRRHRRAPGDGRALVVGCGTTGWRKGTDLFVALAHAVGPEVAGRAVHWAWVGGDSEDGTRPDLVDEIRLRGLEERVHLVGEVPAATDPIGAADLFAMTSREDPYPLAVLEAALTGTPVVGFRPGTALLAAAGQDADRVDGLDVGRLATRVRDLLADPDRARLAVADQARAAAGSTTPLRAPRLWADLEAAAAAREAG